MRSPFSKRCKFLFLSTAAAEADPDLNGVVFFNHAQMKMFI